MIKSPDALHQEIHHLGTLLGEMIARDQGAEMLARVEHIRELGKASRNDEGEAFRQLLELFAASSDDELYIFARAFAKFLNLANIAEQEFFNSPAGEQLLAEQSPQGDIIARLQESGMDRAAIRQAIDDLQIDLVLTAHPTEIVRRSMIQKYNEINHSLRRKPFGTATAATTRRLEDLITQS